MRCTNAGTTSADGYLEVLTEADRLIILKAKERLYQLSRKVLSECAETTFSDGDECDEIGCEDAFQEDMFPKGQDAERLAKCDPLSRCVLDRIEGLRRPGDGRICEECVRDASECHEALRQSVWNDFLQSVSEDWS